MNILLMLAGALLPALLLLLYVLKRDAHPEPTSWLIKAFVAGVLTCIPASIIEIGLEYIFFGGDLHPASLFGTTAQAFLIAAIPEESVKLFALWLVLRKNPFFDEHYDGIVYAVCVGLGFAAIENVFYIFTHEQWVTVAVSRALLAVPGHYAFAVLMGYYYSTHHFVDHSRETALKIILIPVLVHGVYDALAFTGDIDPTIGGFCFFVLIYFCMKMQKRAKVRLEEMVERDK